MRDNQASSDTLWFYTATIVALGLLGGLIFLIHLG